MGGEPHCDIFVWGGGWGKPFGLREKRREVRKGGAQGILQSFWLKEGRASVEIYDVVLGFIQVLSCMQGFTFHRPPSCVNNTGVAGGLKRTANHARSTRWEGGTCDSASGCGSRSDIMKRWIGQELNSSSILPPSSI